MTSRCVLPTEYIETVHMHTSYVLKRRTKQEFTAVLNFVLIIPGARPLTRMFFSAHCPARALTRPTSAVLLTE